MNFGRSLVERLLHAPVLQLVGALLRLPRVRPALVLGSPAGRLGLGAAGFGPLGGGLAAVGDLPCLGEGTHYNCG